VDLFLSGDLSCFGAKCRLDDQELKNSLAIAEAQLKEVSRKHERLSVLYKRGSLTALMQRLSVTH